MLRRVDIFSDSGAIPFEPASPLYCGTLDLQRKKGKKKPELFLHLATYSACMH